MIQVPYKTILVLVAATASVSVVAETGETGLAVPADDGLDALNAIVKLEVQTAEPDFVWPWRVIQGGGSGSGVVVGDGQILTCAHCVSDATFIRIRKNNDDAIYHAVTEFEDTDRDLALLRVEDPAFMESVVPMEIGETPPVQSEVVAVGFPRGGRLISFTKGIVSRIEDIRYEHGHTVQLAAQVDAAINPGNSGGPVLDMDTGKIAGIAFQGRKDGEALGYMIPTDIIRCFFDDIADGRVDGTPDYLFAFDWLESEAERRYLGMHPGQSGIFIGHVSPALGTSSLQVGDVLVEIDGVSVANNGDIRLPGNRVRSFWHPVHVRQIGETVPAKALRSGEIVDLELPATKFDTYALRFLHGRKPDWFVFGGLVFTTFSDSYCKNAKFDFHDDATEEEKERPDDRFVVLTDVLGDLCMEGYLGISGAHVRTVNGTPVRNLGHLVSLVDACEDEFIVFGMDMGDERTVNIVLDTPEARTATPRVMDRFGIPADRSPDLRKKERIAASDGESANAA